MIHVCQQESWIESTRLLLQPCAYRHSPPHLVAACFRLAAPAFGAPASSPFGASTPAFGAASAPAFGGFGASSTPAFGAPTSSQSLFGAASSAGGFSFGSTPAFGAATSTPAFGAPGGCSGFHTTADNKDVVASAAARRAESPLCRQSFRGSSSSAALSAMEGVQA